LAVLKNFTVPVTRMWDVPFPMLRELPARKGRTLGPASQTWEGNRPYGQAAKPQS
jgi:hypothetical protein